MVANCRVKHVHLFQPIFYKWKNGADSKNDDNFSTEESIQKGAFNYQIMPSMGGSGGA